MDHDDRPMLLCGPPSTHRAAATRTKNQPLFFATSRNRVSASRNLGTGRSQLPHPAKWRLKPVNSRFSEHLSSELAHFYLRDQRDR